MIKIIYDSKIFIFKFKEITKRENFILLSLENCQEF